MIKFEALPNVLLLEPRMVRASPMSYLNMCFDVPS